MEEELKRQQTPGSLINGPLPGMEFAYIPGGSFVMGSPEIEEKSLDTERPQHKVTLQPFNMQVTPVTQKQWMEIMGKNPSEFKGKERPVDSVSWNDCQELIKKLNLRDPGNNYRLPSESEWEYSCRAGTTTPFNTGTTINTDQANSHDNCTYGSGVEGVYHGESTPLKSFSPNSWGLYDMHGNVWEWCEDRWHGNHEGAPTDGSAWVEGDNDRVLRGGSWYHYSKCCRSAARGNDDPSYNRDIDYGFRLALSVSV